MAARHSFPLQRLLADEQFDGDVSPNEPMSRHTTYRIGGPAHFFVRVDSVAALKRIIEVCRETETPWIVVGRGSNILVADEGFDGAVIILGRDFRNLILDEEHSRFVAGAGVLLSAVVQKAFQHSLAGLEFAVGTPGTLGGALRMNAGSREEWLGSRVASVTTFRPDRGMALKRGDEIAWGYRSSSFDDDEVMLECELLVEPADPFFIRAKMEGSLERRKRTQPLSDPSCGSVFKNPEGASAGRLIDELGMKGMAIGGAEVSSTHANFIINRGDARAEHVRALIELIQTKVKQAYGIELIPEVQFLGFPT